ncbi:cryptochrome/photolyase family protein [Aliikangiella sp. IMCC44359]|uniref:cryptochrome/photolyase family protein n=1 Tax=Aliikangiella sp. IMCC44359 TaxID=3459125 RepID=UPI00403A86A8
MNKINLVWFRNDLRLDDNPALFSAMADKSSATIAVYLMCEYQWDIHTIGINQRKLIIEKLKELKKNLKKLNIPLLIINSKNFTLSTSTLVELCHKLDIQACYFNTEYLINERVRDKKFVEKISEHIKCYRFNDQSLTPPWDIVNGQSQGYKVFSAYARAVHQYLDHYPVTTLPPPPKKATSNFKLIEQKQLEGFDLLTLDSITSKSSIQLPNIKEKFLLDKLNSFCKNDIENYQTLRDIPSSNGTSQLSAALAIGAISVKRCYETAKQSSPQNAQCWINELVWRDFYRSVAWHFPRVVKGHAFNPIESKLLWSKSAKHLKQWKNAETGIPIVDAAIKQLITTGWMHNRLRMIVASYLTKNLWIDWREGEQFFANHLFDYDFASNNGGWQWCASVGTDAAPYFRVFNPASQQKKFDPEATFIKQWLPQISKQPAKLIHQFETRLLADYYPPQVDLKSTRKQAIESFKAAKNT